MSPWQQRMARDREEIRMACAAHDKAIDAEPIMQPVVRADQRIILEADDPLPRGTYPKIVTDFVASRAYRFTVDVGPSHRRMASTRLCLLRAAESMGAKISVRQKRGLVIIERAR